MSLAQPPHSDRTSDTPETRVTFADVAADFHDLGLNVLPVGSVSKRPPHDVLWRRWQTDRQTIADLDHLRRMYPAAGIAIILGGPGLSIVDVDVDDGERGEADLRSLNLPLPATAEFTSPGDPTSPKAPGRHLLFEAHPAPMTRRLAAHLELRSSNVYTVVPPTRGRSWTVGLEHLATLPVEWRRLFGGMAGNRRTFNPPIPTPLDTSTASNTVLHIQDCDSRSGLARDVWSRLVARLGMPAVIGQAFLCPLPGHDERSPSAAWHVGVAGEIVLHDFHRRSGPEFYTIVEVYAATRSDRVEKLSRPSHAIWGRRLRVELGFARLVDVRLLPLPPDAAPFIRRVYTGIALLFGCRWLGTPGDPAPLERNFLSGWCGGLPVGTVAAALLELRHLGIIRKVGHHGRAALFLPGGAT